MKILKYIPNTITCLNLASGCMAIVMAFEGHLQGAILWIMMAAFFDFMDGLTARLLKAYSPLGKELDSLSDVVSFGVAPGMALYVLLRQAVASMDGGEGLAYLPYLAFVIPVFSGLRLAKFNLDERQTSSFIGMPVPAHALFWGSLVCYVQPVLPVGAEWVLYGGLVLAFLSSYLLVSEIPMFSMKVKTLAWRGNEVRYVLLVCGLLFIAFFGFLGVAGTVVLYFILSLFNK